MQKMKIEHLRGLQLGGHSETNVILVDMQIKINELIDAYNKNQLEDDSMMTFEEALVHFRNGKKIGRKKWAFEDYFDSTCATEIGVWNLIENDWRVIE